MTPSALLGTVQLAVAAQTPAPSPSPGPDEFTIYTVTPGISGFIVFFVLALVGWLLFRSLVKHMRRVDQETLRRERQAAEEAAAGAQTAGATAGDATAREAAQPRDEPSGR